MTQQLSPDLRWIAFDLDDTLHHFKRASGRAAEAVFLEVERQFGIGAGELAAKYHEVLRAAQSDHFSSPKSSSEYRAQRFSALLREFSLDTASQLDRLLDVYDAELAESLELKPGAYEALQAARQAGRSVMVISEGPHDAQQTTIERLGIGASVDLLVTSAGEGISKTDGLFEKALDRGRCRRQELLVVGDSLDRDIAPAAALGIAAVYVGAETLPDDLAALRLSLFELAQALNRPTAAWSAQP